jgi:hypothetical protein
LHFLILITVQDVKGHPYGPPNNCPWKGIILRALYMFTKLRLACPLLPQGLDITDTIAFRTWLSEDPGDFAPHPFHNGLKIFLWLINDYYNLFNDPLAT